MKKPIWKTVLLQIISLLFSYSLVFGGTEEYVIVTEPLDPLSYLKDGKIVGISTEIVEEVFKQAQIKASIYMYPWKRAYNYALRENNHFIFSILRNQKRENLFQWIGPILWRTLSLYRLKERTDIVVNDIEDMKKYKTGVQDGDSMHQVLLGKGFKNEIHLFSITRPDQALLLLFRKRVDLIYFNNYTGKWRLDKYGRSMNELEKLLVLEEGGYYIGANKGVSKDIVQRLQASFDNVKKTGFVEKVVSKYLSSQ